MFAVLARQSFSIGSGITLIASTVRTLTLDAPPSADPLVLALRLEVMSLNFHDQSLKYKLLFMRVLRDVFFQFCMGMD